MLSYRDSWAKLVVPLFSEARDIPCTSEDNINMQKHHIVGIVGATYIGGVRLEHAEIK